MSIKYKIQFQHGVGGTFEKPEPIHFYKDINEKEYVKLKEAMELQQFVVKIERAYEHIVGSYEDFEKNIFSIILENELYSEASNRQLRKQYSSFIRHLLNILTSTHLQSYVFKIKRKNEKKKDTQGNYDFSFENSADKQKIYKLKIKFKETTNCFHKNSYQYTFMSALRNKLNHGGTLPEGYTSGGYWSLYFDKEKTKEVGIVIKDTDQRFTKLDYKILKETAKQIIKKDHFDSVEINMPDVFYLRQAIRIYVDLLSEAHAKVRSESETIIHDIHDLIKEYLSKSDNFSIAMVQAYENEELKEEAGLFLSEKTIEEMRRENTAPLHIERYAGMPGEHRDLPVGC